MLPLLTTLALLLVVMRVGLLFEFLPVGKFPNIAEFFAIIFSYVFFNNYTSFVGVFQEGKGEKCKQGANLLTNKFLEI